MKATISVRIPKTLVEEIKKIAEEESRDKADILREIITKGVQEKKIEIAIKKYKDGKISLWKAARYTGISLWTMIELLKEKKVELQYGEAELESDLKALEE
ncbi:MAG: UPF0175 family protein [Candidatus Odinarchaeota archaeon]|nr:UPF0175 family protein [Candidatus Odinarchaeota archaeon]